MPVSLGAAEPQRCGPVVILSCRYSGAELFQQSLSRSGELACTASTGILPLCASAISAWQVVEGRGERDVPSRLALTSVRTLLATLISTSLAASGGRRWCELSTVQAEPASAFLHVFPEARFVCLYRACTDVILAGIRAHPLGLAGSGIGAAVLNAYPGNTVAALASYWASHTESLLTFEAARAGSCLRLRQEDLGTDADLALAAAGPFLGLAAGNIGAVTGLAAPDGTPAEPPVSPATAAALAGRIPDRLADRVNALHAVRIR